MGAATEDHRGISGANFRRRDQQWEQMLKQRDEEWKEEIERRERSLM